MAHLVCVLHRRRSIVIPSNNVVPVVVHRSGPHEHCTSTYLRMDRNTYRPASVLGLVGVGSRLKDDQSLNLNRTT